METGFFGLPDQTRPPELVPVDDASKDDWTFTVNPEWHHRYPDIKGYRRDSNNLTSGDAEPWSISVRVKEHGLAQLFVEYPPYNDIFSKVRDGIWDCPRGACVGFIVHASVAHPTCRFIEPNGGTTNYVSREVFCPNHERGTIFELSCPSVAPGSWIEIVFRRQIIWNLFHLKDYIKPADPGQHDDRLVAFGERLGVYDVTAYPVNGGHTIAPAYGHFIE